MRFAKKTAFAVAVAAALVGFAPVATAATPTSNARQDSAGAVDARIQQSDSTAGLPIIGGILRNADVVSFLPGVVDESWIFGFGGEQTHFDGGVGRVSDQIGRVGRQIAAVLRGGAEDALLDTYEPSSTR